MPVRLLPCPSCSRHVRVDEIACPFCLAPLADSFSSIPPLRVPTTRLGRAATFAFGTAVATTLNLAGCGDGGGDTHDTGAPMVDAGDAGGEIPDGGPGPVEDASPPVIDGGDNVPADGGPAPGDAGMRPDDDGGSAALYGAPPPEDAGVGAEDGGGPAPLYGAPPGAE